MGKQGVALNVTTTYLVSEAVPLFQKDGFGRASSSAERLCQQRREHSAVLRSLFFDSERFESPA